MSYTFDTTQQSIVTDAKYDMQGDVDIRVSNFWDSVTVMTRLMVFARQVSSVLFHGTVLGAPLLVAVLSVGSAGAAMDDSDLEGIFYGGSVPALSIGVTVVVAISNTVYQGHEAEIGWKVVGYVAGCANLAMGAFWLSDPGLRKSRILNALSAMHFVFGVSSIGLTIWSSALPGKEGGTAVSLSPLLMTDSSGGPAFGVGLSVISW